MVCCSKWQNTVKAFVKKQFGFPTSELQWMQHGLKWKLREEKTSCLDLFWTWEVRFFFFFLLQSRLEDMGGLVFFCVHAQYFCIPHAKVSCFVWTDCYFEISGHRNRMCHQKFRKSTMLLRGCIELKYLRTAYLHVWLWYIHWSWIKVVGYLLYDGEQVNLLINHQA